MNVRPTAEPTSASLCPIPRAGMQGIAGILLFLFLILAASTVGIGINAAGMETGTAITVANLLSIVSLVLLTVYMWRVTRTAKAMVPLLAIVGVALFYFTNSVIIPAVFCGLIFVVAEGAFFLAVMSRKHLLWFPLIPIVAYAATLAISRDPLGAAAALIPFPPALALAWGTRSSAEKEDGPTRVGVICAVSGAMLLSLAGVILLVTYRHLGSLSPEALINGIGAIRTELIEALASTEIPDDLGPELKELLEAQLTYAYLQNQIGRLFNLLPAVFVIAVNFLSASAQIILHASLRSFGYGESLTERVRVYRMSLLSCIAFLLSALLAFGEATTFSSPSGTVAQNAFLILLPGLAIAGIFRILGGMIRKGARGLGCLFYLIILFPILLIFAPPRFIAIIFVIFAALEVIGHIISSVMSLLPPPDDDPFDS